MQRQRKQTAAPQTTDPQAAAALPDEFVWKLLLQELWQIDTHLVAKLLCCSMAMSQLVHSTCAYRLSVNLTPGGSAPPPAAAVPQLGCTLGRWLAKHMQLVHSLALDLQAGFEDPIAAGMQLNAGAAAAQPSTGRRTTRAAAAAQAAAAAALSLRCSQPAQLPFHSMDSCSPGPSTGQHRLAALVLHGTSTGRLLHAQAGSQHLTRLELTLTAAASTAEVRRSLSSLCSLQDLNLRIQQTSPLGQTGVSLHTYDAAYRAAQKAAQRMAEDLLPALQHLTQLTALVMRPGCLRQRYCRYLPVCLRALSADKAHALAGPKSLDLSPLTDLTRLSFTAPCSAGAILSSDVLPAGLQVLHALVDSSFVQVLKLQELQHLDCNWPVVPEDLQQLQKLTKLETLNLTAQHLQLEAAAALLTPLPIKQLTFDVPSPRSVDIWLPHMPQWTSLGSLFLMVSAGSIAVTFTSVAAKLQKLPLLHTLAIANRLAEVDAPPPDAATVAAADWGVFVKEICGVKSLHTLMLCHVQLKEAAAQLSAVTQLTRLALVRCEVGEAARQELQSKLGAACVKVVCDAGWDQ